MTRRLLAVLVVMAASSPGHAASPVLDGSYGSKEGCLYARTGESSGAEDFFLLTKEALTTAMAYCEVKSIGKTDGKSTTVTFSCQAEGEDGASEVAGKVTHSGKDAVIVTMDGGTSWGPYKRCR